MVFFFPRTSKNHRQNLLAALKASIFFLLLHLFRSNLRAKAWKLLNFPDIDHCKEVLIHLWQHYFSFLYGPFCLGAKYLNLRNIEAFWHSSFLETCMGEKYVYGIDALGGLNLVICATKVVRYPLSMDAKST